MKKTTKKGYTAAKRFLLLLLICLAAFSAAACGEDKTAPAAAAGKDYAGKLRITELMAKNRSALMSESGTFPDWIELENVSDEAVQLEGFTIADGEDKSGWRFPALTLPAGERLLIYADGSENAPVITDAQGRAEAAVRVNFALSEGECVYLYDARGALIDKADCGRAAADTALSLGADGQWEETFFPTPGYENSRAGYDAWQSSLLPTSPLIISEVVTANFTALEQRELGFCDHAELKNISSESVELSEYCLSDDDDELERWRFPAHTLAPGESVIVLCDKGEGAPDAGFFKADFELSSEKETLYLSRAGEIADAAFLRAVPYGGSYGRMDGEGGWFYFSEPQPLSAKHEGCRRISAAPVTESADGVFEGVKSLELSLAAEGKIYYTLDGSLPDAESEEYTAPLSIEKTCVVRAVAVEDGALPSRALSLSFIINEGHSLPVVSLAADDPQAFERIYKGKRKGVELPGALSFYAPEGSFTINCGIDMHGETSLEQAKKNMGLRFRGAYGAGALDYDLYGGGVTRFEGLILRAGQDQNDAVIRNELVENLALQFSDRVFAQRNRSCVLYINGEYRGIYALTERCDERRYAAERGVSEESVSVIKAPALTGDEYYDEVIRYAKENDLTDPEKYREFCERVDIDSLIDWLIIEGWSANADIYTSNLRYARSTEDGGRWSYMLYDLDSVLMHPLTAFVNVLSPTATQNSVFVGELLKNGEFRDKFLTRAAEALNGVFTNENAAAEADRLAALLAPEIARDFALRGKSCEQWEYNLEMLRDNIVRRDWRSGCIRQIAQLLSLTQDELAHYFG